MRIALTHTPQQPGCVCSPSLLVAAALLSALCSAPRLALCSLCTPTQLCQIPLSHVARPHFAHPTPRAMASQADESKQAAAAASAAGSAPAPALPAAAASSSSQFRPSFSNLLGASVWDENVKLLSDFLFRFCTQPDVEIEGKLGLVYNKKTQKRLHIDGVRSLVCCATDEIDASFAAEIDANMFRHFNEDLLQRRFLDDQAKAKAANARPHWRYAHTRITDKFHTVGNDRVRVSYDSNGAVIECIVKEKLEHVDFWNGKAKAIDFRISASRERKGQETHPHPTQQTKREQQRGGPIPLLSSGLTRLLVPAVCLQFPFLAPSPIRSVAKIACRIATICGRSS